MFTSSVSFFRGVAQSAIRFLWKNRIPFIRQDKSVHIMCCWRECVCVCVVEQMGWIWMHAFRQSQQHMQLTAKNHFELNYFELLREFNINPMNMCTFFPSFYGRKCSFETQIIESNGIYFMQCFRECFMFGFYFSHANPLLPLRT